MSGLYFHIPFCKTRCIYCAFYSSTFNTLKDDYTDAICKELELRLKTCPQAPSTIYFGGGTPSQLTITQLQKVMSLIPQTPDGHAEITIECNPDDITPEYAQGLKEIGFNRVSLGVQTFDNNRLKFLQRRHNRNKVFFAIETLQKAGFGNISIDLMYGFPNQTLEEWKADIETALSLNIQHISCYCLTYEEETRLYEMLQNDEVAEIDDDTASAMYYYLIDRLADAGFQQYEISNFSLPGYHSHHNSSYWDGTPYIGIGAGAHSYDGNQRSWNICDVKKYIKWFKAPEVKGMKGIVEKEVLTKDDKYNELIMTRLRTIKGLDTRLIPESYKKYFSQTSERFIRQGLLVRESGHIHFSREALFISDSIISSLFKYTD